MTTETAIDPARIDTIIDRAGAEAQFLIGILLDVQDEFGYLPGEALKLISERLDVPMARLIAVGTFYKVFSLKPLGKHVIRVCDGTACHVRGAPLLVREIKRELGIGAGETTADGLFTLETVNCLGACALAPVLVLNDEYHEKVTSDKLHRILAVKRKETQTENA